MAGIVATIYQAVLTISSILHNRRFDQLLIPSNILQLNCLTMSSLAF